MKFTIKDNLAEYSAEELAAKITEGQGVLEALFANESPTPADVAEAKEVLAAVEKLEAESTARSGATDEMAALREQRLAASQQPEGDEDEDDPDAAADDEAAQDEDAEEEPVVESKAEEPVVAAAKAAPKQSARQRLAGKKPATPPPSSKRGKIAITAAADVPTYATGSEMPDLTAVGDALVKRTRAFPKFSGGKRLPDGSETEELHRFGVAQFAKDYEFEANSDETLQQAIDEARKESRLEGGNLIAAGGWCAPSEVLYDLCEGETTDGLIDLPEIGIRRGGIRFTQGPSFSDLYNAGFTQTEAQAIAGTTKTCYSITCPTWTDVRMDAMGICIKVPILTNAGFPELTRRVVSGSLIAHQHRVSAGLITKMVTASGTAVAVANMGSVASSTLAAVELVTEQLREQYRMGLNETLEVVAPVWLRGAIRADLAHRNGVDLLAVSDAQINSFFSARKVRVQWVYNWQMLVEGEEGYPATVQFMAYPAGSFVKGGADVISLDAVYDAASLSVNEYTGLFFEEGVLLAQTCFKSKLVTVPVQVAGRTGANDVTGAAATAGGFLLTP